MSDTDAALIEAVARAIAPETFSGPARIEDRMDARQRAKDVIRAVRAWDSEQAWTRT